MTLNSKPPHSAALSSIDALDPTGTGLLRVKVVQSPARPARKGVPNPFRPGETMDVAAKPARRKVKALPLSKLKAMIG